MLQSLLSLWLQHIALVACLPHVGQDNTKAKIVKRQQFDPISDSSPGGIAGGQVANDAPPVASFFEGLKPPFPTNGWWAPYAATPGNGTAAGPFPYQSSLDGSGVFFGISQNRSFDGTSVVQRTQKDWHASFAEHDGQFSRHKATAFDSQAVTVQYFSDSATMDAYLVPGSPYMTFDFNGATPLFTSAQGGIKSFNGQDLSPGDSVSATGTQFLVTDTSDTTYIIYALSTISLSAEALSATRGTIRAQTPFTGVLRLAQLEQASHQELLDAHFEVYPTAASIDYVLTDDLGTLIFDWETVGSGDSLLMLTWPHHRMTMQGGNFPDESSLGYLTTKGWMHPAIGSTWRMNYELSEITWNPPRPLDESCEPSVRQGLAYEVGQLDPDDAPVPNDFYFWGGTVAAHSRLALIADSLGETELVAKVVEYLKASFEPWFQASSETLPAFETGWGGIINKAGASNVYVDFGNGYYNDHHFHYGYFLNIAAVIARYDKAWLEAHREYINWFARDIINPTEADPHFPVVRCRDWFAGHSWASGIANGAGSRDQESIGEAINGYYGALLWASVALSPDYVNYAKFLVATEQHASQVYWHLYPSQDPNDSNTPYPEAEVRDLITIGNVMDYQSGAFLWWGSQKVQIAAIQILPVIPVNEAIYDPEWVGNVWDYTMPELIDPAIGDEWRCVITAAYANAHPQAAAAWSANFTTWGSGNTYTNELHFIGTRPNPSGSPICGSMPSNPYGSFRLQHESSSNFVVASGSAADLIASASSNDAAVFDSAYVPNAGTLQLLSTSMYVTADSSGDFTLSAARETAGAWEKFTVRPKTGSGADIFSIRASSNGRYVTVGSDGSLRNNGVDESDSAGFRFVPI